MGQRNSTNHGADNAPGRFRRVSNFFQKMRRPELEAAILVGLKKAGIATAQVSATILTELATEAAKGGSAALEEAINSKIPGAGSAARIAVDATIIAAHDAAKNAIGRQSAVGDAVSAAAASHYQNKSLASSAENPNEFDLSVDGAYECYPYQDTRGEYEGAAEALGLSMGFGYSGGFDSSIAGGEGCPCEGGWIGGADMDLTTVKDYSNSLNAVTKDKIIDQIIDAVGKLGFKAEGADRQDKVKSLLKIIPDGKKFASSDAAHKRICEKIADVINMAHGNKIINKDLPADVICQQVSEIVSSLAAGMHTEFLAVYADVRRVLKNLHILKQSLNDDFNLIMERINTSDDATLRDRITTLTDLHQLLLAEVDRQTELLQNLLNITLFPAEKDLSALIKSKKDVHGYIEKIDIKPGNERFGKVISDILKGLGLTANFALLIDRALKTVGMSVDEFSKNDSVTKLREKITSNLMGKKFDEKEMHEYLQAAELLYKNFYRKEDIAKAIEKTGKFEDEMNQSYDGSYDGGDVGDDRYHKTVMDKRIADRKKLKNLIFTAFYKRISDIYNGLVDAMENVSKKVGSEIPLSDQLDGFRHVIQRINEDLIRNKNIYQALIGYYNDALSKSKRDALIGNLKMVSSYIDSITEMSIYKNSAHYFKDIQAQIKSLVETIDKYSDEIAAKFGRGEDSDPECQSLDKQGGDEIEGGAEGGDITDPMSSEPKIIVRTAKTINDAFRKFDYYYRVAQIKSNLNRSSKELDSYSEKYEKIIANSIVDILEREKRKYDAVRKDLANPDVPIANFVLSNAYGFDNAAKASHERESAIQFLDAQWEARKKFWATVEAIDTYMRVFTDGLVKNPNDIKEIKSMLDEIEIISDWYNENSGNDLAGVFDYFPSLIKGDGLTNSPTGIGGADKALGHANVHVVYPPNSYRNEGQNEGVHYYEKVASALNGANAPEGMIRDGADRWDDSKIYAMPGNPHIVTLPSLGLKARNQVRRTMMGLGVLKNLISVFVHIGSKFGGEELRKKVFLTPAQIYNNLIEFLQASAFAQGFGTKQALDSIKDINTPFDASWSNESNTAATYNVWDATVVPHGVAGGVAWPAAATQTYDANTPIWVGLTAGASPNATVLASPAADQVKVQSIYDMKKRYGVWMRSINGRNAAPGAVGLQQLEGFGFAMEDDYFVMILKAIAAKIFTVTGMYDVIDRPLEVNALSPIRMIIGGADDVPKVEEGAVELYLRLPLLAQFYRNIFGFTEEGDNKDAPNDWTQYSAQGIGKGRRDTFFKIAMVPDIDGVFAGLVKFIFRKAKNVDNQVYTEDDVKELVREINLIYQRMQSKYPQNTVMETIYEFVAEINRRYGIVSRQERDKYEREFGYRYDYAQDNTADREFNRYSEAPDTDIAILPGETDEEVVRPSSAERLLSTTFDARMKDPLWTVTKEHKQLVYKFRCAIDKLFEKPNEEYTFKNAIKAAQNKLKKETKDEERLKIVAGLIRGVDIYSKADGMKYVLFHETVVSGLNMLSAIHSMLQRFKKRILYTDLKELENKIWAWFERPHQTDGTTEPKNLIRLQNELAARLSELGLGDTQASALNYVEVLTGLDEAQVTHGGHYNGAERFIIKRRDGVPSVNDIRRDIDNVAPGNFGVTRVTAGAVAPYSGMVGDVAFVFTNQATAPGGSGLMSLLAGHSVSKLKAAHRSGKNTDDRKRAETFFRFLFNREFIMKELVETLFGLSNDMQGLVDLKVDEGKIFLGFGGLKKTIEDLFTHVSYFIDLLRPHIRPELIQKYTAKTNPGSYYWLQEQLVEKILVGRPAQPSYTATDIDPVTGNTLPAKGGYVSLEDLARKANDTYMILTKEYDTDGSGLNAAALSTIANARPNRTAYDKVFAELIFYDASRPSSGLNVSKKHHDVDASFGAVNGLESVDFKGKTHPIEGLHMTGAPGQKALDTRYAARFKQLYSWDEELTPNRSVLFSFNQLIAKYLQSFYDSAQMKIYGNLIHPFASGSFNRAVMDQLSTYPDTQPLFMFKAGHPDAVKFNSADVLKSSIYDRAAFDALKRAVTSYIKFGVAPGHSANIALRAKLLDPAQNILNGVVVVPGVANPAGGAVPYAATVSPVAFTNAITGVAANTGIDVPKVYIYLAMHLIANVIHDIFYLLQHPTAGAPVAGATALNATPRIPQYIREVLTLGSLGTASVLAAGASLQRVAEFYRTDARGTLQSGEEDLVPTVEQIVEKLCADANTGAGVIASPESLAWRYAHIAQHSVPDQTQAPVAGPPIVSHLAYYLAAGAPGGSADDIIRPGGLLASPLLQALTGGRGVAPGGAAPGAANEWAALKPYYDAFNSFLVRRNNFDNALPAAGQPAIGTVLFSAMRANAPYFSDMIGNTGSTHDLNHRCDTFATLVAALATEWLNIEIRGTGDAPFTGIPTAAEAVAAFNRAFASAANKITAQIITVPQTFSQAPISEPRISVKMEDAFAVVDNMLTSPIDRASDPGGYLRVVRHDPDSPFHAGNPWSHLPGAGVIPNNNGIPLFPADLNAVTNFGRRWDPDAEHILFTSLSVILKTLITVRNQQNQAMVYIQENVADVNLYMKEKYRALLPVFKLFFKELRAKCEYLKRFVNRPEINLERKWTMTATGAPNNNPWPWKLVDPAPERGMMSSAAAKTRFTQILDSIERGVTSLVQACDQVTREVGDDPKYFELGQNSIKDYKSQYGYDPLMPLSSTLAVLKNVTTNSSDFLPVWNVGSDQFKFLYGTRLLLNQPNVQPLAEHNPGWNSLLESFNLLGDSKGQVDKSRADAFMKTFVKLLRYVYELKVVKGNLTPYQVVTEDTRRGPALPAGWKVVNHYNNMSVADQTKIAIGGLFTRDDLVVTEKQHGSPNDDRVSWSGTANNRPESIYNPNGPVYITNKADVSIFTDHAIRVSEDKYGGKPRTPVPAFSIAKPLSNVIQLTESSFKDDRIKEIVDHLLGATEKHNSLEIQNIIDLNIVPINVHALMREVPLANLYNYAYTFDRLIVELYYGFQNENARKLISELCSDPNGRLQKITNAKDMLVQLLIDPYLPMNVTAPTDAANGSAFRGFNLYEKFAKKVLVGATGNELGRPKFLSDQLFNKSLFGEVYSSELDYNEQGPRGSVRSIALTKDIAAEIMLGILDSIYKAQSHTNGKFGRFILSTDPNYIKLVSAIARYMVDNPRAPLRDVYVRVLRLVNVGGALHSARAIPATLTPAEQAVRCALATSTLACLVSEHVMDMLADIGGSPSYNIDHDKFKKYFDRIAYSLMLIEIMGPGNFLGVQYNGAPAANPSEAVWAFLEGATTSAAFVGAVRPATVRNATPHLLTIVNTALGGAAGLASLTAAIWNNNTDVNVFDLSDGQTWSKIKSTVERIVTFGDTVLLTNQHIDTDPAGNHIRSFQMRSVRTTVNDAVLQLGGRNTDNLVNNRAPRDVQGNATLHWLAQGDKQSWTEDENGNLPPGAVVEPDNENVFNPQQIKSVDVSAIKEVLSVVGRLRFDTVFIRNLMFIVNLYRSVRYKLSKDLTYNRDIITKSAAITRADQTEFYGNSVDKPRINYSADPRFRRYAY